MATITSLEGASLAPLKLTVKKLDADLNETTATYTLCLDFNALAKANEALGKDFANITSWQGLSSADFSTIAWACFDRFHPEVTLREVRQFLGPVDYLQLGNQLIEMAFPGITERCQKAIAENASGESQPSTEVKA